MVKHGVVVVVVFFRVVDVVQSMLAAPLSSRASRALNAGAEVVVHAVTVVDLKIVVSEERGKLGEYYAVAVTTAVDVMVAVEVKVVKSFGTTDVEVCVTVVVIVGMARKLEQNGVADG